MLGQVLVECLGHQCQCTLVLQVDNLRKLELQRKVHKDFTIINKAPTLVGPLLGESASWAFTFKTLLGNLCKTGVNPHNPWY